VCGKCVWPYFCDDQDPDDHSQDEGALDAVIRRLPTASSDAETHSVHTASESSPTSGPRRSARLAGTRLPREASTSTPLHRSARLRSTQRGRLHVTAEYDGKW
jgi:hypothetical protein